MKTKKTKKWIAACLLLAIFSTAICTMAETINPGDYSNRMRIAFPGYSGTESLTNFPTLIKLTDGDNGLSVDDFESDDYSDLRFTESDGTTTVPFEVEQWFDLPPAVISPTNLTGCQLWLKADLGAETNTSGSVTNWIDQSGSGHNATSANVAESPQYITSALNGLPAVSFDGSNDRLTATGSFDEQTIIMVLNNSDNPNFNAYEWPFGSLFPRIVSIYGIPGTPNFGGIGTRYVNGVKTSNFSPLNEYKVVVSADSSVNTSAAWLIGRGDAVWSGGIAEVIVYDRALLNKELNDIYAYLNAKYALNIAYIPATANVWVKVPELNSGTTMYGYWGNTNATTIPGYTTDGSTWNSEYAGVWHLGSTNEVEDLRDSTANSKNGTDGTSPYNTENEVAYIGDGQRFDWNGSNFDYVNIPDNTHNFSDIFSVSLWANFRAFNTRKNLIGKNLNSGQFAFIMFGNTDRRLNFAAKNGGQSTIASTDPVFTQDQWHHVAATVESGNLVKLYVDGEYVGGGTLGYRNDIGTLRLGRTPDTYWGGFEGLMDEARISTNVRSPDWVKASYENQNAPTSFASLEVDGYWDTSTASGLQPGNGTWSTTDSAWSSSTSGSDPLVNWENGWVANFIEDGTSVISVDSVSAHKVIFSGTGYELTGGSLALGSGGIEANEDALIGSALEVSIPQTWNVSADKTLTFSSGVSGSGRIIKSGSGILEHTTDNSDNGFSGGWEINEGVFKASTQSAWEATTLGNSSITINSNATLLANANFCLGYNQAPNLVTVNPGGTLDMNGKQVYFDKLTLHNATVTGGGTLWFAQSPWTIEVLAGDTMTVPNIWVRWNNRVLTLDVKDGPNMIDLICSGPIQSTGQTSLKKIEAGTASLLGASTYPAGTTVENGTLLVNNTTGSGTGTGPVTINGGVLGGTGTVANVISFGVNGGAIAPGSKTGTLTANSNVVFTATGTATNSFNVTVDGVNAYSQLHVTDNGIVTLDGATLNIELNTDLNSGKLFIIVNDGSDPVVGTFDGLDEGERFLVGPNDAIFNIYYSADAATGSKTGGNDVALIPLSQGTTFLIN